MRSICMAIALLFLSAIASGQNYRFEAETGTITTASSNNTRVQNFSSASGGQFVGQFPNQDPVVDLLTVSATLPEGLYDLFIGYRSRFGDKGFELSVGDVSGSGMFSQSVSFTEHPSGQFYIDSSPLNVEIREGWGYYDIDYFEFRSASVREPLSVNPVLANANASPNTRYLMNYLTDQYGTNTLFGQQREYYNPNQIMQPGVLSHTGGIFPALVGGDLMSYSPSRVARGDNPNGESERLVNWAQQTGGIVSLMWHWNAPSGLIDQPGQEWWRGFYTDSVTFDLGAALDNPQSADYGLLIRDMDVIAAELLKFKQADVPVIWRPLHEAQGNDGGAWFWWGNSGPDALKELWGIMYDRFTNHHGLDNLIWVSTTQVEASDWQEWYPGDDMVDIVGVDIYSSPNDNMTSQWTELLDEFDGEKLIALSETGSLPPENVLEQYGVAFSYMTPWNEEFLTNDQSAAVVQGIVGDDDVIDLSELPVMPWRSITSNLLGDYDGDGDVDNDDLTVWQQQFGLYGNIPADGNGDGIVDAADYTIWRDNLGAVSNATVPEPAGLSLALFAMGACSIWRRRLASGS